MERRIKLHFGWLYVIETCYVLISPQVYGRFLAQDHDSGRTSYFISRKTYLKVTDLIGDYLRVSDTQIASIKGQPYIIQGVGAGRTEVQVILFFSSKLALPKHSLITCIVHAALQSNLFNMFFRFLRTSFPF